MKRYSAEFWSSHVQRQRASGMTKDQYVKEHGISKSALYRAEKRENARGGAVAKAPKFVPVALVRSSGGFSVRGVGDGRLAIEIDGASPELISRVLTVLMG